MRDSAKELLNEHTELRFFRPAFAFMCEPYFTVRAMICTIRSDFRTFLTLSVLNSKLWKEAQATREKPNNAPQFTITRSTAAPYVGVLGFLVYLCIWCIFVQGSVVRAIHQCLTISNIIGLRFLWLRVTFVVRSRFSVLCMHGMHHHVKRVACGS
jgi:hypothetical protein